MRNSVGYQGWTNYETWCVALWVDNDYASYERWHRAAETVLARSPQQIAVREGRWTLEEAAVFDLADKLKAAVESEMPQLGPSMYSDLLNSALSEVDWKEIAESILESESSK